jgi:hypothetical protein
MCHEWLVWGRIAKKDQRGKWGTLEEAPWATYLLQTSAQVWRYPVLWHHGNATKLLLLIPIIWLIIGRGWYK